jgi:hypothetical protein
VAWRGIVAAGKLLPVGTAGIAAPAFNASRGPQRVFRSTVSTVSHGQVAGKWGHGGL